jgi:hypothetical protein
LAESGVLVTEVLMPSKHGQCADERRFQRLVRPSMYGSFTALMTCYAIGSIPADTGPLVRDNVLGRNGVPTPRGNLVLLPGVFLTRPCRKPLIARRWGAVETSSPGWNRDGLLALERLKLVSVAILPLSFFALLSPAAIDAGE